MMCAQNVLACSSYDNYLIQNIQLYAVDYAFSFGLLLLKMKCFPFRERLAQSHLPILPAAGGSGERSAYSLCCCCWRVDRAHSLISSYFALQIHPWLLRGRCVFNTCCPGWRDQICSARATNTHNTHGSSVRPL
jgi:hypothetical protein